MVGISGSADLRMPVRFSKWVGKAHMPSTLQQLSAGLLALVPMLASCGGDNVTAPTTGSIEITTSTSGPEPDADGYTVSVDNGAEIHLAGNATHLQESLQLGSHSIFLGGISSNCTLAGENPRTATVE